MKPRRGKLNPCLTTKLNNCVVNKHWLQDWRGLMVFVGELLVDIYLVQEFNVIAFHVCDYYE